MHVIKIGGAAGVDMQRVVDDVANLRRAGHEVVLVHGGSDEANRLGEALGHPPQFVTSPGGHQSRLTDEGTLEVFLMATALVNRRLVSALGRAGVPAFGLSGLDGNALVAERKRAVRVVENGRVRVVRDDRTGKPVSANGALLRSLLAQGFVPVLAPVAVCEDGGAVNVDGDRAAAVVAGELGAENLLLMTAVPGLMREFPNVDTLVRHVPAAQLSAAAEWAEGRMQKKVLGAQEALNAGVARVIIAGTEGEQPLSSALAGAGTVLGAALSAEVRS